MFTKGVGLVTAVCFMLLFAGIGCASATDWSAPNVNKIGETALTGALSHSMNGASWSQEDVISYGGWQYVAFYSTDRYVSVARRKLPNGNWEVCKLRDSKQTSDDGHDTVSMGICPSDGTIHLAYTVELYSFKYRKSIAGLATNPESHSWVASNFGPVQDAGAMDGPSSYVRLVYPRFIIVPNGKLQFTTRRMYGGGSGDRSQDMYEYDGSTGKWTFLGKFMYKGSGQAYAYLHGIAYDNSGRLHIAFNWRDSTDGSTNHDLCYIYSDDYGRTWKNNAGIKIGTTGSKYVTDRSPGVKVASIGRNRGYMNQECMAVDSRGRVHVLVSYLRDSDPDNSDFWDARDNSYPFHYWRDINGNWHKTQLPFKQNRHGGKIALDSSDNAYALLPHPRIASASASTGWTDWRIVHSSDDGKFQWDLSYDSYRLKYDDKLSICGIAHDENKIYILDYKLAAGPAPTGTISGTVKDASDGNPIEGAKETTGGDYYVATWGSDSNPGTKYRPWATPSYAAQQAKAGDTIYLMDGTWKNEHVVFANSGTEGKPITMKAYPGATPVFDGVDKEEGAGINFNGRNYINIQGLEIKNYGNTVRTQNANYINISNCILHDTSGQTVTFHRGTNHCTIDHCEVYRSGFNVIQIRGDETAESNYNTIKNSEVYDNDDHNLIDLNCDYPLAIKHTNISNNIIHDVNNRHFAAIFVHNYRPVDTIIEGNEMYNVKKGIDGSGYIDSLIRNNVIHDTTEYGVQLYGWGGEYCDNVTFENNKIYNTYMTIYVYGYSLKFHENNISGSTYRIKRDKNAVITNEKSSKYKIYADGSSITVKYTDGRIFSVDGAGDYTSYTETSGTHTIDVHGVSSVGTISGTVTDAGTGLDIEGATVSVEGTGKSGETYTNRVYAIASVPTGTNVPVGTTITVTFSEAMNQSSTEGAFSISPSVPGSFSWNGNKMIFTPSSNLAYETIYTVNISTEAEDLAGNNFESSFSWQFRTLIPGMDLIGEWHFDEGSGGIAVDSSGNGNNGTISNPLTMWITEGKTNSALQFDGTNDYVEVQDSSSLDSITNGVTLIAWVKTYSFEDHQNIIEKWDFEGVNQRSFELKIETDGTVNWGISSDGTFTNTVWLTSNGIVGGNTWTHLAVTSDGETMKIFINGEEDPNKVSAPSGGIYTSTADLHIGRWWGGKSWIWPFNGTIDEVKIYNRALSAGKIKADYEAGVDSMYPSYDVNEDGKVDILDTTIVGQHFGETTNQSYPSYDVNEDGKVDILDTTIVGQHFGEITS